MKEEMKKEIGARVRSQRERAGYSRERMGELCSLSPRFIANIEFGDATFSLDSLMVVSRVLSCSCDYLLFGQRVDHSAWQDVVAKLENLDVQYHDQVNQLLQSFIEGIRKAEQR